MPPLTRGDCVPPSPLPIMPHDVRLRNTTEQRSAMTHDPLDPKGDPFGPPEVSVEVECLHCGRQYDSYLIEWRIETDADGKQHGFWCCPTPDCGGRGFGFDIFPTDPEYRDERGGWFSCDEEDFNEDDELDDFSARRSNRRPKAGQQRSRSGETERRRSNSVLRDSPRFDAQQRHLAAFGMRRRSYRHVARQAQCPCLPPRLA